MRLPPPMTSRPFIVAIDGPAGAGKSTVSKVLARRLGFTLVDTGAIYRSVALKARREGLALDDDAALGALLARVHVSFEVVVEDNHVFLDGEDVSEAIRTPDNSMAASQVSSRPVVRDGLLSLQRRLARAWTSSHGASPRRRQSRRDIRTFSDAGSPEAGGRMG